MNRNETLQFVGATVKDLGNSSVAITATFSNLLSSPQSVLLSGIAYPARGIYEPFSGGKPFGPICCPIVRSYSTNGSVSASAKVDFAARGSVTSSLVFPSLNRSGIYWVRLLATSLNQTVIMSPFSYLIMEAANAQGNNSGGACGGEEAVGPLFSDHDNGQVYVANPGTEAMSVIDGKTGSLVATISLPGSGGYLTFLSYDPASKELFVESEDSSHVFAVDTLTNLVLGKLSSSQVPKSLGSGLGVYDPDNGLVYSVYNGRTLTISNASTNALKANVTLPPAPNGSMARLYQYRPILYNPTNKEVYVYGMDFFDGQDAFNPDRLLAISTSNNSVVASIPVAGVGGGLVLEYPFFSHDSSTGNVLATTNLNRSRGTMGLLQIDKENTVISQVTFPGVPFGSDMAFDPKIHMLYAAQGPASVLLLDPSSGASVETATFGTCGFALLPP